MDPKTSVAKVKPSDFEDAAKHACGLNLKEAEKTYPKVEEENLPYLCMDLVYQYTLLIDGFGRSHPASTPGFLKRLRLTIFGFTCIPIFFSQTGLDKWQEITLVKKVQYGDRFVEAAWPLGSALEAVSSE